MSTLVGGRYRLDQRIATGGMGEVWRATDTVLNREVAVKLLKSEYADDATSRARFKAEARHTAQLHHPGIASIFDFGEHTLDTGDTTAYLVMELVEGEPLSVLLQAGRPLAYAATARVVADAATAVQVAHDAGIVHRDIKPANLLITPEGAVKVTDFGIARAGDAVPLTQTGQVIGTPHYLAPEQAEGKAATSASDIYALGVVLYECLAGRRPFDGETPIAVAIAHLREEPPALPSQVPAGLAATCLQAMAKDPAQRPASAAEFAAAVRRSADDPPGGAAATGTAVMGAPFAAAGAGAAGLGAAAAAAAGDPPTTETPAAGDGTTGDGGAGDDSADGSDRRRPPWLVPALAVAAVVLAVASIAGLASTLGDGDAGPSPGSDQPGTSEPAPSQEPTDQPSEPADEPSEPADEPSEPADEPPDQPSEEPAEPTQPTEEPSEPAEPTEEPSEPAPSQEPTDQPTEPTEEPSEPTEPTEEPSEPTEDPSTPTAPSTPPATPSDPPEEPAPGEGGAEEAPGSSTRQGAGSDQPREQD